MTRIELAAPLAGFALPLREVPDAVFADGLAGDGVAIDPTGETLHAPCAGTVELMAGGAHALTLRCGAAEILLHVGIDTVKLGGLGFELCVGHGRRVLAGQPLLRFSLDRIIRGVKSAVTPILLTGPAGVLIERRVVGRAIEVGDFLMGISVPGDSSAPPVPTSESLTRSLTIPFENGLHARPAALVASALKGLAVNASVAVRGREANARSVSALMALGARRGDVVDVVVRGIDAATALAALEGILPPPRPAAATKATAAPPRQTLAARGMIASPGLAIGVAVIIDKSDPEIFETGSGREAERGALKAAVATVQARLLSEIRHATSVRRGILEAHLELVADPELERRAVVWIDQDKGAAFSFRQAINSMCAELQRLDDPVLRERTADLRDIGHQIVRVLSGEASSDRELPEQAILLGDELMPSDLIGPHCGRIAGLAMARGGATSHVAIIAASMGIPALVGVGTELLSVAPGTPLILDAEAGQLHFNPSPTARAAAAAQVTARAAVDTRELAAAALSAATLDGVRIRINCNISGAAEAAAAVERGAEGCGLLRTELLFIDRRQPPTEEEQAALYAAVGAVLAGRPLTIRTLDAGGDKPIMYLPLPHESNPALGLRGLRTSLRRPDLLDTQLRAILRVSDAAACRILLPMVTDAGEVRAVRAALGDIRNAIGSGPMPSLGAMIETPASAVLADQLAAEADFLSIGTNDLAQYTLAMDRTHPELASKLDALHPAVLRLIQRTTEMARTRDCPVAVCGGLASDPLALPILLGLGVHELSAVPRVIPHLKALVRELRIADCEALARSALLLDSAMAVRGLVRDWLSDLDLKSGRE